MPKPRRKICFVTGTRAEFGLTQSTLRAIAAHPALSLQLMVTGMHLDSVHGAGLKTIRQQGWCVDAVVPWKTREGLTNRAIATGTAIAGIARQLEKLGTDIVLVVGDRVEAFAAAAAGQLSGKIVAHVHGGDRAAGQVDDSLRHAIAKLAQVHFPATTLSRKRLIRMGEDVWRIHSCGSPGIDGIVADARAAARSKEEFALIVYHPVCDDDIVEARRMRMLINATLRVIPRAVIVYPNNDPGTVGVQGAIEQFRQDDRVRIERDVPRVQFLGLMRDAAFMIGNSSSGIIEAASFGTPVIDVGDRQLGREHGSNVSHVPHESLQLAERLQRLSAERFRRFPRRNIYGGQRTGEKIAAALAKLVIDQRLRQKLIAY